MTSTGPAADAETALVDLRLGHVTKPVIKAVRNAAAALVRTKSLSTPNGSWVWSDSDIDDLVGDFFARPQRIAALADRAGDGPDAIRRFRGALQTSLKHVVIDRYHEKPQGVLSRRIERRMKARADVADVAPRHWALIDHRDKPHWDGDDRLLVAAVSQLEIDSPPPWDENSERQPPATTTRSVDLACTTVLAVAESPVEQETVQTIVVERVFTSDSTVVQDSIGRDPASPARLDEELDEQTRRAADSFWHGLTDTDKALLPFLATPARQLEDDGFLGLKKSAIDARQKKLKAALLRFAGATRDGRGAVNHVLEMNSDARAAGQIGEVSGND